MKRGKVEKGTGYDKNSSSHKKPNRLAQAQEGTESFKSRPRKGFREDVSNVVRTRDSADFDSTILDALSDVMEAHVDVFAPRVMGRVVGQ